MSQPTDIATVDLRLDIDNPRFGPTAADSEPEALQRLFKTSDLRELWFSIAENGFLSFEPLIAMPSQDSSSTYTVIEGNRRLAAVKTLLDPSLLGESRVSLPILDENRKSQLARLPVIVVDHREDADQYIGFRHVNGARTWEPLPKTQFALRLFEKLLESGKEPKEAVDILARQIGEKAPALIRNMIALKVLFQAYDLGFLPESAFSDTGGNFSHLYTMLSNPETRDYVGLGSPPLNVSMIGDNPIPESNIAQLRHLCDWLFGSVDGEDKPLIRSQGPDRPALQKIIKDPVAREQLERTRDFAYSRQLAGVDAEQWMAQVYKLDSDAKKVFDGVGDAASEMTDEDKQKVVKRLESGRRRIDDTIKLLS